MCSLSSIPQSTCWGACRGSQIWGGGGWAGRIKRERKILKPFNCCVIGTLCSVSYYSGAFHVSFSLEEYFSLGLCKSLPLRHLSSPAADGRSNPLALAVVWLTYRLLLGGRVAPSHSTCGGGASCRQAHVWLHSYPHRTQRALHTISARAVGSGLSHSSPHIDASAPHPVQRRDPWQRPPWQHGLCDALCLADQAAWVPSLGLPLQVAQPEPVAPPL